MKLTYCKIAALLLAVLALNPLQARSEDISPYLVQPKHYDTFYGKNNTFHLTGAWKFKPEVNVLVTKGSQAFAAESTKDPKTDNGITEGYFKPGYDDTSWQDMPVPWVWNQPIKEKSSDSPRRIDFAGVGYFRKTFTPPALQKGQHILLHFASVQTACKVWVNGKLVGEHVNEDPSSGPEWGFDEGLWLEDFEFDVTDHIVGGKENNITVRVYDDGLPISWNTFIDGGGICGPVTLKYCENVFAPEILIDPDIESGEITLRVTLNNFGKKAQAVNLKAEVSPFKSEFYTPSQEAPSTSANLGKVKCPAGEKQFQLKATVPNPVLWDVDNPFLYHFKLFADGKLIGQTRFGFRKFEVRGREFYLNNKQIRVMGINPANSWNVRPQIYAYNKANALRLFLKITRQANITFSRVHNGPCAKIYYDICDEIGLISQNDFSPKLTHLKPEEITRAEFIAQAHVGSYLNKDLTLSDSFKKHLRKWFVHLYNHPGNCMFTGGNELGHNSNVNSASHKQMVAYINGFYDYLKEIDGQDRPVTSSSGLGIWAWRTPVKSDYFDHHSYVDGEDGWADCVTGNIKCIRDWERIYGKSMDELNKPVINGELAGFNSTRGFSYRNKKLFTENGDIDKKEYVRWLKDVAAKTKKPVGYWDWNVQRWYTRWQGARSLATRESTNQASANMLEHMNHMIRRDMHFLSGVFLQDVGPRHFGLNTGMYAGDEKAFREMYDNGLKHVEFQAIKRSLAPQLVSFDMYDRHWYAGDTFRTDVHVMNDKYADDGKGYVVSAQLVDTTGKELANTKVDFGYVKSGTKEIRPISLRLNASLASGDYTINVSLQKNGVEVNSQSYPVFIENSTSLSPVKTNLRIALYDTAETMFRGLGAAATRGVLESLNVPYSAIHDMNNLKEFDLLIIGANSIDQNITNQAETIRNWLENGGKVVCMEQSYAGPVPFLSEMRLQYCGNVFRADLIEREHPSVKSSQLWHWELWNGLRSVVDDALDAGGKKIYDTFILPMSEGVVVAGGPRGGGWVRNITFGMVSAEIKAGKGLVFFSQSLATSRYGKDPVADKYLHDLFKYTLSPDWDGRYASPVSGKRVTFVDRKKCFFVDLSKAANVGFADGVDSDQKGGWTDQGKNDLRGIPRGDVTFMGMPYKILDDLAGSNSCIVLKGSHRPHFPVRSPAIYVGKKADRLAFLHAVAWGKADEKAGVYNVKYSDGTSKTITLSIGNNIGGWWSPSDIDNAIVAWTWKNLSGAMVGLYTYDWKNPTPDKKIESIDFVSAEGSAIPALVAITGIRN